MLQPHELWAEFEAVIPDGDKEKLKEGAIGELLRAAQVARIALFVTILWFPLLILLITKKWYSLMYWSDAGSNCFTPIGRSCNSS